MDCVIAYMIGWGGGNDSGDGIHGVRNTRKDG